MKFGLLLITLLIGQIAYAQSMREIRIREAMLNRIDELTTKTQSTQDLLARRDVGPACKNIKEMFDMVQEHVKDIHTHLDIFSSKVINTKQDAVQSLLLIQQNNTTCKQGQDNEYIDPKKAESNMKVVLSSLKKQRKVINKAEINEEENSSSLKIESSSYEYRYEYRYEYSY